MSRRLALEAMEVRSSYRLRTLARAPAKRTQQERQNQLRELAVAAGVPASDVKKTLRSPRYHDIVREAGDQMGLGADITEFIWSGCSSLAHGDLSGTLGLLDKEIVARDKDVAYTRVTGSISGLYWSTVGAALMIEHGFNRTWTERPVTTDQTRTDPQQSKHPSGASLWSFADALDAGVRRSTAVRGVPSGGCGGSRRRQRLCERGGSGAAPGWGASRIVDTSLCRSGDGLTRGIAAKQR